MKKYSTEIANAIKSFLEEDEWYFSFDNKKGTFSFGLYIKGKIKQLKYSIRVRHDDYIVYAFSPIGSDEEDREMMLKMYEFVSRANYGLCSGNFEIDYDGELRFKSFVDCSGSAIPNMEIIKNSIYCPAAMFRRYSLGILLILFGGNNISAKDAIAKCEGNSEEELLEVFEEVETESDEDTKSMLGRLAARLGFSEEGADTRGVSPEKSDDINPNIFKTKGGAA